MSGVILGDTEICGDFEDWGEEDIEIVVFDEGLADDEAEDERDSCALFVDVEKGDSETTDCADLIEVGDTEGELLRSALPDAELETDGDKETIAEDVSDSIGNGVVVSSGESEVEIETSAELLSDVDGEKEEEGCVEAVSSGESEVEIETSAELLTDVDGEEEREGCVEAISDSIAKVEVDGEEEEDDSVVIVVELETEPVMVVEVETV